MSAEIHRLTRAGPLVDPQMDVAGVIAICEEALAKAKAGEIKGIAICYVAGDDSTVTDWDCGVACANFLLAATTRLFYRVAKGR